MSNDCKSKIITDLMSMNYLVSPYIIKLIPNEITYEFFTKNILPKIEKKKYLTKLDDKDLLKMFEQDNKLDSKIQVVKSFNQIINNIEVKNFVNYFKIRYENLKRLLQQRIELQDAISIKRLNGHDRVSVIGLVYDKSYTKNNNIILQLEDTTGFVKIIIKKDNSMTYNIARDITLDEVIGVTGTFSKDVIFVDSIILPDTPNTTFKKCNDDVYAAFISDLHIGSNMFLPEEFNNFIKWLNGNYGTDEQKKLSKKIKYLFIIGDLVDGVGIYPNQEDELFVKDINEQYKECAKYLSKIRKDINIIICAGNHDSGRIAEPQLPLDKYYAKDLYELNNVIIVSNPSIVNIHAINNFPGFNVLLYHGFSFDYYISNIDSLRNNGGYDRADLLMKWLLQKRHLAPTHTSTLYVPNETEDPLVISIVPDFFVTGHIHKLAYSNYKSTTVICCSCWQSKTSFQEKVGHNPEPGNVPIVNLKTREIKVMNFCE